MTGQLGYSMFQDVLFPATDPGQGASAEAVLKLRRLKRFLPDPAFAMSGATLVVFDLETTGLDPEVDRIIEVGAIKLKNMQPVAEFSTLVQPEMELTDEIIKITGITQAMLEGQPKIDTVLPQFLDFMHAQGDAFKACCPKADDIWLHAMALRAGLRVRQLGRLPRYFEGLPGTHDQGLVHFNSFNGGNDRQVAATYVADDLRKMAQEPA